MKPFRSSIAIVSEIGLLLCTLCMPWWMILPEGDEDGGYADKGRGGRCNMGAKMRKDQQDL